MPSGLNLLGLRASPVIKHMLGYPPECFELLRCSKATPFGWATSSRVGRRNERLYAAERRGIDDRGAAVAVAAGNEDRGHVIAEERDVGAMCSVGDVQRAARGIIARWLQGRSCWLATLPVHR